MLPQHIAASKDGERIVPLGIRRVIGVRTPAFSGMSVPMRVRKLYMRAERVTDSGALVFESDSGEVPSKSKTADPSSASMVIFKRMMAPLSRSRVRVYPLIFEKLHLTHVVFGHKGRRCCLFLVLFAMCLSGRPWQGNLFVSARQRYICR